MIPKPIRRYDCIGVISVSGPVDQQLLLDGLRNLHYMGFDCLTGANVLKRQGYLAGADSSRISDLNNALSDPNIAAIIFARGGYGVMRILEKIDLSSIFKMPKILVGMSDLTAMNLSLYKRCNLVTFAGPMVATENGVNIDNKSLNSLIKMLTTDCRGTQLITSDMADIRCIRSGKTSGRLLGGCLSMVTALLGTNHMPDFSNQIMFLEEINEPLYKIDRMLMHLKLSGFFNIIGGLLLGHFIGPNSEDQRPSVEQLVMELTREYSFPIISGYPHGHVLPNFTLPHGALVEMNADNLSLSVIADQI